MDGDDLLGAVCRLAGPEPEPAYVDTKADADVVCELAEDMGMSVVVCRASWVDRPGGCYQVTRTDG